MEDGAAGVRREDGCRVSQAVRFPARVDKISSGLFAALKHGDMGLLGRTLCGLRGLINVDNVDSKTGSTKTTLQMVAERCPVQWLWKISNYWSFNWETLRQNLRVGYRPATLCLD